MGRRGPAPKPSALRVLDGTVEHHPINAAEPKPDMTPPECPEWLDEEAKAKWPEVVTDLTHMGLLSHADGDLLAAYCQTWADFQRATIVLRDEGTTLKTARGDVARPEVAISRNSKAMLRQLAQEFGLSPSSRGRMTVPMAKEEADDLDSMLGM